MQSQQPAPQVDFRQLQVPDFGRTIQEGIAAGQRARRERELHELEVERRRLEIEQMRSAAQQTPSRTDEDARRYALWEAADPKHECFPLLQQADGAQGPDQHALLRAQFDACMAPKVRALYPAAAPPAPLAECGDYLFAAGLTQAEKTTAFHACRAGNITPPPR